MKKNMAETRNAVNRALIFESGSKNTANVNGSQIITDIELKGKIIARKLKFFDTVTNVYDNYNEVENKFTKASNQRQFNFTNDGRRAKPSVRMLVYEDSSDEEIGGDKSVRSTPPNVEKRQASTPGAPMKSRKEFDKKVLRPKKLVYCSDREKEENQEENVYKNLTEIITMPRKIFHLPSDEELYSATDQKIISNIARRGRKKSRNRNAQAADGTRKRGKSRNAMFNDDKENNANVLARELNGDSRQDSESQDSRFILKNYDRGGVFFGSQEELSDNLSKPGEFTHFRI